MTVITKQIKLKDILSLKYIRYRNNEGKLKTFGALELYDNTEYRATKNAITQLLKILNLKILEINRLNKEDYKYTDNLIFNTLREASKTNNNTYILHIIAENNTIYAITSDDYITIPHRYILDTVGKVFNYELKEEFTTNNRKYFRIEPKEAIVNMEFPDNPAYIDFNSTKEDNTITPQLLIYNSCKGTSSLGYYGYLNILRCSNGLITPTPISEFSIRHIHGDMYTLLDKFKEALTHYKDFLVTLTTKFNDRNLINRLYSTISFEKAREILIQHNIPKTLIDYILYRELRGHSCTIYYLIDKLSYYGSHTEQLEEQTGIKSYNTRLLLMQEAYKILTEDEDTTNNEIQVTA